MIDDCVCRLERRVSTHPVHSAASVASVLVRGKTCASVATTSGMWTATDWKQTSEQVGSRGGEAGLSWFLLLLCVTESETSSEGSRSRSRTQSLTSPSPTSSGRPDHLVIMWLYLTYPSYRSAFIQEPSVQGEQCWRHSEGIGECISPMGWQPAHVIVLSIAGYLPSEGAPAYRQYETSKRRQPNQTRGEMNLWTCTIYCSLQIPWHHSLE